MARNIIGVIVGLTAATIIIWTIEMVSHGLFPLSDDLGSTDMKSIEAHIKSLPTLAFVILFVAHALGTFVGAWVGALVADSQQLKVALVIGCILMALGLYKLFTPTHPYWSIVVDMILYIPSAYMGYRLFKKKAHNG